MKLSIAKNIITKVFVNPFEKEKFIYFIRSLQKNLHPAEFLRRGHNIPILENKTDLIDRVKHYLNSVGDLKASASYIQSELNSGINSMLRNIRLCHKAWYKFPGDTTAC